MSDISIREHPGVTQIQLIVRNGKTAQAADSITGFLGRKNRLAPMEGATSKGLFICATGPGEYWVFAEKPSPSETIGMLTGIVGEFASLFDQSEGRYVVRLEGRHARSILAKGTALDLYREAFPAQGATHSVIEHIPALVARRTNCYDISVPRSYEASFITWLNEAAREYGPETVVKRVTC